MNQSPSEVMQKQSNYLITFDAQLKTTLLVTLNVNVQWKKQGPLAPHDQGEMIYSSWF